MNAKTWQLHSSDHVTEQFKIKKFYKANIRKCLFLIIKKAYITIISIKRQRSGRVPVGLQVVAS